MENLFIETERLVITEFNDSMVASVHENSLDEDIRLFVPDEVFETVEDACKVVSFLMDCYRGNTGPFVYPVLLKSGENIGYVQVAPIEHGRWEIGYHIAKKYTGNGYATEAVKSFLPVIMARLVIDKIEGLCLHENFASRAVLDKCGFKSEYSGTGNYHGSVRNICRYSYQYPGTDVFGK